jgi:GntR family transcriptional regulator, sialic acid-inducible nan operon repressor
MSSEAILSAIPRRKLSHDVLDRLVTLIRSGAISAGDKMPSERELMNRFGVGRPVVREALMSLAQSGLIEIVHGERARVVTPSARDMLQQLELPVHSVLSNTPGSLDHLKQARLFFEVEMVRMAAEKADRSDITMLHEALDVMRDVKGRQPDFIRADMQFHVAIARISKNPIYEAVSEAMLSWLAKYRTELVSVRGADRITISEHEAILEAIASRKPVKAKKAMTAHLSRANDLYRTIGASSQAREA